MMNRPAPYAEALQFDVQTENTTDTDQVVIVNEMIDQAFEKVNDLIDENLKNRKLH
jgi:hypothetical protein